MFPINCTRGDASTRVALCRGVSDANFRRAVLVLLIVSGASLVTKAVV